MCFELIRRKRTKTRRLGRNAFDPCRCYDARVLLTTEQSDGTLTLRLSGSWRFSRLKEIEQALESLSTNHAENIVVDCSGLEESCLAAAWLLRNRLENLRTAGANITYTPTPPEHFEFLQELSSRNAPTAVAPAEHPQTVVARFIESIGKLSIQLLRDAYGGLEHFGRIIVTEGAAVAHPRRMRLPSIVRHVYETGIAAVPIVALIAFFTAVIIAYLGAQQLRGFGATIYTVDLIAVGVLRELGVLLTAIIVAGRSGSAFAAEIGVMQLNDEIDALKSMGLSPVEVLVLPRVLGLIIALPLLTIVADLMGLAGGALLSAWLLDISVPQFVARVQQALAPTTFWAGLIKAPVFAFLIAIIGTYRGLQVRNSSQELGRLTTDAVVQSIFMVIFANAVFAIIYDAVGF